MGKTTSFHLVHKSSIETVFCLKSQRLSLMPNQYWKSFSLLDHMGQQKGFGEYYLEKETFPTENQDFSCNCKVAHCSAVVCTFTWVKLSWFYHFPFSQHRFFQCASVSLFLDAEAWRWESQTRLPNLRTTGLPGGCLATQARATAPYLQVRAQTTLPICFCRAEQKASACLPRKRAASILLFTFRFKWPRTLGQGWCRMRVSRRLSWKPCWPSSAPRGPFTSPTTRGRHGGPDPSSPVPVSWDARAGMWWGAPVPGVAVASRLENSQALLCTCWWRLVIFRKAAGAQLRLGSLSDIWKSHIRRGLFSSQWSHRWQEARAAEVAG